MKKKRASRKKQDNSLKRQGFLFLRYLSVLIIGLTSAFTTWFYQFLLILTIYPVSFLLNLSHPATVSGHIINLSGYSIEIIPACVAVSAYLLLFILNLTTPMAVKTRLKALSFSLLALLAVNILRIYILSIMFLNNSASFEIVHQLFWYILSTVLVVGIWFISVYLFKIKDIPGYSDLRYLIKNLK